MKLNETTGNVPLSAQQLEALRVQMYQLNPLQLSKLIKDLEDIKRGGSKWRLEPSNKGFK